MLRLHGKSMNKQQEVEMHNAFTMNWWALLLRGIAAILFGVLAFVWPAVTLLSLVFVFGAYAILDGIFAIIAGFRAPSGMKKWWWLELVGIVSILAGVLAFALPNMTAFVLVMLIAAWAIIGGIFEIIAAIQLRTEITGEWLLILGGAASIVFGVLMTINPTAGALVIVWIVATYAILYGALLVALSLRLRGLKGSDTHHHAAPHPA
jgi:uncharacterized membrane protein HdeD (DUF308 family)